ncbi:hypothetical protein PVK62_13695 [Aliivibrio sp. S3MY1]|uniref:hypothetical protein n=1 Tax=Aliivibrio sp. S3MY1 TaxID=3028424 RepID=UPI0023782A98|nr:hypothetical protein [Aliivibrio sp. S3MY1]MDD9196877.1 hypothetical protein [Aliivibrio sp. S3MY1]
MNTVKSQQHITMYLIAQKHEAYGYTSLETLAQWDRKLPKKNQSAFTCKKVTTLNNTKYNP